MTHKSYFRKLWVKFFSANSPSVILTACEMRLALAFLGSKILVVKEVAKKDHFERWSHKMAHKSQFGFIF